MEIPSDEMAQLWFLVRRVAGLLDRTGDALFRAELGISLAHFLVLSVVDAYPGRLSQQVIADRLGLTKGTVSRQIDSSIRAGLMTAEVSPVSRRENVIALTKAGTKLVRHGDQIMQRARRDSVPAFAAADLSATIRTLSALGAALEKGQA